MATNTEIYALNSFSSFPNLNNSDLTQINKKDNNSKKIFSRKPNKLNYNSSRFVPHRLKTQQPQNFDVQILDMTKNDQMNANKQTSCLKFLSNKSSKSLEKLIFTSSSMQNLPVFPSKTCQQKNQQRTVKNRTNLKDDIQKKLYNRNKSNTITTSLSTLNKGTVSCDKDFNDQLEMILAKDMMGSTQLSSNENICISQFMDGQEQQNEKIKPMTLSGFSSYKSKSYSVQCPFCSMKQTNIKQLKKKNNELVCDIKEKQSEIKQLNEKINIIERNLQRAKNIKINLQSQIKVIKQNSKIIESQKEEIQKFNRKLQSDVKKLTQDLKYKQLQVNISKIYKTKSLELEFKVQTLKKELERAKVQRKRLESSKSMQNLQTYFMKRDFSNISLKTPGPQRIITQKKPNIKKVYEEDSLFSLTSESCD